MCIFQSSPKLYPIPKYVKKHILVTGLTALKLFAHNARAKRCWRACFSYLGPITTYNQERGDQYLQLPYKHTLMIKTAKTHFKIFL